MEYPQGCMVMFKRDQGAETEVDRWHGPGRVIGLEKKVVWLIFEGVPVASATHLLRPATVPEMLAAQALADRLQPLQMYPLQTVHFLIFPSSFFA